MKKFLKIAIISISLNLLFTNSFATALEKNKFENLNENNKNLYTFQDLFDNSVYVFSEKFEKENKLFLFESYPVLNLLYFYILDNIPEIPEDYLENCIFLRYSFMDINLTKKEREKINSFLIENIEKIKEKKYNFNNIKQKYKNLNEKIINKFLNYINTLQTHMKNKEFVINFAKTYILRERRLEGKNILKEIEFKEDKNLYDEGLKAIKKEIEFKKAKIKELKKHMSYVDKVTKDSFEKTLKHITQKPKYKKDDKKEKYLRKAYGKNISLRIYFKELGIKDMFMKDLYKIYFSRCLCETILEDKDNEEFKEFFKKILEKQKEKNKKTFNKYLKEKCNINRPIYLYDHCTKDAFFDNVKIHIYCYNNFYLKIKGEETYLRTLAKYINSEKFKEKLQKNLNSKYFTNFKDLIIQNNKKIIKHNKDTVLNSLEKENAFSKQKNSKKENIKFFEKSAKENKELDNKSEVQYYEKLANEAKEDLNNPEKLKVRGEINKKRDIKNAKTNIDKFEKENQKLENLDLETFTNLVNMINIKKVKLINSENLNKDRNDLINLKNLIPK